MNIADMEVGSKYILLNIQRVGQNINIQAVTQGDSYRVIDKQGDSVAIENDNGRKVWLKAFRFIPVPQQVVMPAGDPFQQLVPEGPEIRNDWAVDPFAEWRVAVNAAIDQVAPAPIPVAEWKPKVGERVRIKQDIVRFPDDPGWDRGMDRLKGMEAVIKRIDAIDEWVEFEGAEFAWYYFHKSWVEPLAVAPVAPAKPFEWVVGAAVMFRDENEQWYRNNPIANNPGYVEEIEDLKGKVLTIRKVLHNPEWFKLDGDPENYTYCKEWLVPAGGAKEAAPKVVKKVAPPKFKIGDVVVIQDGNYDKADRWIVDMDATIGDVTVIAANADGWFECDNGFSYPIEAFREANKEERKLAIGALLRKAQADNIPKAQAKAGGVSTFTIWTEEDGVIKGHDTFSGICHAALGYKNGDGKIVGVTDYLFAYVTQVQKDQHADYKAYVDYVINRSPWHVCWKKSSVDRALKEGLQLKVDMPAKLLGAACVALRMGKEFAGSGLPIYTMCVNAGYEEAVAWVVQQYFSKAGDRILLKPPTGAHTVLDTHSNIGSVVNLLRYGYDDRALKDKPYTKEQSYRGFTAQISEQPNPLADKRTFMEFVNVTAKGTIKGEGFNKVTLYTEKDVFAVADALTHMFHKLDVME